MQWGPCEGQELDCGGTGGDGNEDAGRVPQPGDGGNGGKGGEPSECPCVPGSVIFCDEDCKASIYCKDDAQQTCLPDGTWGPCKETTQHWDTKSCMHKDGNCDDCNTGKGFFMGDCSGVFACPAAASPPAYCACGTSNCPFECKLASVDPQACCAPNCKPVLSPTIGCDCK